MCLSKNYVNTANSIKPNFGKRGMPRLFKLKPISAISLVLVIASIGIIGHSNGLSSPKPLQRIDYGSTVLTTGLNIRNPARGDTAVGHIRSALIPVTVTFDSITVHDSHDPGNGQWFLTAYVQGQGIDLTKASCVQRYDVILNHLHDLCESGPSAGLRDVGEDETVYFPAGATITVLIPREIPLSIMTVGAEQDDCTRPIFPDHIGNDVLPNTLSVWQVFKYLPRDQWESALSNLQYLYNQNIGEVYYPWDPCAIEALNGDDTLGLINEIYMPLGQSYEPNGWGSGVHGNVVSSSGDFTLRYTINVQPSFGATMHSCQGGRLPIEYGVTASSSQSGFPASNAIDNDLNTKWVSGISATPSITADLGKQQEKWTICSVDIAWADGNSHQYFFTVSTSTDGINFQNVYSGKSSGTTTSFEPYELGEPLARYVKITKTASPGSPIAQVSEILINGHP